MSLLCYDSTNPLDIPANAEMVAGYDNGIYVWSAAGWARFAGRPQWHISVTARLGEGDVGNVLDVEKLDATPQQAGEWAVRTRARGVFPIIYCNRDNRPAVEGFLQDAGLSPLEAALWIATLDGTQQLPVGPYPIAGVQYLADPASGGHYDLSLIQDAYGGAAGGIDVTQSEKRAWVTMAFIAGCFRIPTPGPELDAIINSIHDDGSNVAAVLAPIYGGPEATAKLAAVNALIANPPAPHIHTHTLTAETSPSS